MTLSQARQTVTASTFGQYKLLTKTLLNKLHGKSVPVITQQDIEAHDNSTAKQRKAAIARMKMITTDVDPIDGWIYYVKGRPVCCSGADNIYVYV